jgi:putative copper export protein
MQILVILLRLVHVVSAILWFGGLTMLVMFVVPAIDASGPVGQQFMQQLMRHTKVAVYMPVLGVLTVLSGLSLYWRNA